MISMTCLSASVSCNEVWQKNYPGSWLPHVYPFLFTCAPQRQSIHFYTLLSLLLTTPAVFERLLVPKWAHPGPIMWSKYSVYQCLLVFTGFTKNMLQTRSFAPQMGTMGLPRPPPGPPSVHFETKHESKKVIKKCTYNLSCQSMPQESQNTLPGQKRPHRKPERGI